MTSPTLTTPGVHAAARGARRTPPSTLRVLLAVLARDIKVTFTKDFGSFVVQIAAQPLLMLFIFAKVLGALGFTSNGLNDVLVPGTVSYSVFLAAMQAVSLPLVVEFGYTREIEDRLMAPVRTSLIAVEKVAVAAVRGLIALVLMFPAGEIVVGGVALDWSGLPLAVLVGFLGGWAGGAVGLIIGTFLPANKVNIMYALILAPLLFTGCSQYPWPSLSRLPWFQVVTALNPMTYSSEGIRAAVVPQVPHLSVLICLPALVGFCVLLTAIGIRGFRRRAMS
jgi:ABC-2 type transport system permease protein